MSGTKFAWLPVRLYEMVNGAWVFTGEKAWLKRVRVVLTIYGDVVHTLAQRENSDAP